MTVLPTNPASTSAHHSPRVARIAVRDVTKKNLLGDAKRDHGPTPPNYQLMTRTSRATRGSEAADFDGSKRIDGHHRRHINLRSNEFKLAGGLWLKSGFHLAYRALAAVAKTLWPNCHKPRA
jgi:hypothetical protein